MSVSVNQLAVAGGTPVRNTKERPWPSWPIATEEDIAAVAAVLRSGKWNRWRSDRVVALEEALKEFTGAAHVVALASGTAGLEVALKAAGVRPGDEVIVPAYTYIATATAVLQVGGVPVFADIIPETENVDPASMETLITERTRALLPVHVSGLPCDMAAILGVAERHSLRVIEDTAQGIGGMWNGRRLGTIGDAGAYSFQASKNLPGGEGGAVVTNDPAIAEKAFMLMHINYEVLGWNYRLTGMTAALILSQLERFPALQARRQANAAFLRDALAEIPGIAPTRVDPFVTGDGLHGLGVRYLGSEFSTGAPVSREAFAKALRAEGIPCALGYGDPVYRSPLFQEAHKRMQDQCPVACDHPAMAAQNYAKLHLPNVERLCAEEALRFNQPMLLGTQEDMQDIIEAVAKIHANQQALAAVAK
ncbi:MAG: DegT/DnrJ/EryC1/StrS family aminotransferase [Chloroflexi bacterium]|nr:DegT/DnrJ/EryC1/StrS family aminotransferase [Chloroflexota bacterium]